MKLRTTLTALSLAGALIAPATAGAATTHESTVLADIHTMVDADVMADAINNYGLPVTTVNCYSTGPSDPAGITLPGIACWLTGPGFTAWGVGVLFPTVPNGRLVNAGMVYWPVVNDHVDGKVN